MLIISLVQLYYNIGRILEENSRWRNKFIDSIANDNEFVQLVAQIPWKHNIILIQKIKAEDEINLKVRNVH